MLTSQRRNSFVNHRRNDSECAYPKNLSNFVKQDLLKNSPIMANNEKTRYTDAELEEFRQIINAKIAKAQGEIDQLRATLNNAAGNGDSDTAPTFKVLEEGAATLNQQETASNIQRQIDFVNKLKAALVRIDNKTYGICRVTGKLIPAERLRAVPHATTSVEGKMMQKK